MKSPAPDTLKLDKTLPLPAIAFAVARVPGAAACFLGSSDFQVSAFDPAAEKPEPKPLYAHDSYVTGVALAGKTLVTGGYDGKLVWWDTAAGEELKAVPAAHAKWVRKVVASPDGKTIASVADDMVLKLWDGKGKLLHELKGHAPLTPTHFTSMLYTAAFSADGQYVATADKVGHVVVWDVAAGKQVLAVESPGMYTWDPVQRMHSIGGARSVAFSPDGTLLAVGGTGKIGNIDHLEAKARIELFDWRSQKSVAVLESDKHKGLVNKMAFAPDGSWLLAGGGAGEGFLLAVDPAAKKIVREEKLPMHVHDFAVDAEFRSVVAVGHQKLVTAKLG